MKRLLLVLACLAYGAGCSSFGPNDDSSLRVMTRNVYVGGDVDRIVGAQTPQDVPLLVLLTWQEVIANDFEVRAEALADEIERERPHLVGLQEITTFRLQDPGDAADGGSVPATDVAYDFLDILLAKLDDRGLAYEVAGLVEDTDAEMPMVVGQDPLRFVDVRMTDYDAVIARSDVAVESSRSKTFDVLLQVPSIGLTIKRGYVAVDARVDGVPFRFVSTHLEPVSIPELQDLQLAQATELVTSMDDRTTILVGDLNTGPGDPTYGLLREAEFRDAWEDARRQDPGLTCCYAPDLRPGRTLETRYDLVLFRNGEGSTLSARSASRVGVAVDGSFGGRYPSDHAGVSVTFTAE